MQTTTISYSIRLSVLLSLVTFLTAAGNNDAPRITSVIEWWNTGMVHTEGNRVHPNRRQVQPLLDHPLRDPSICQGPEGWYYLTGTDGTAISGEGVDFANNDGIRVWRSQDLSNWELVGKVFDISKPANHLPSHDRWTCKIWPKRDGSWDRGVQAPEIHYLKDTFWIVYSISGVSGGILKSTSGTAEGPYVQWAKLPGFKKNHIHYDSRLFIHGGSPSLFEDDDGQVYLLWGRGKIARLSDDLTHLAEPPRAMVCDAPAPEGTHAAHDSAIHVGRDGFFMAKREGRYWLFACDDVARGNELVSDVYVASSETPYGPFDLRRWAIPHAGQTTVFTGLDGHWHATYCGDDPHAAFTDRVGIVPLGWAKLDHGDRIPRPEHRFPRRLLEVNTERYLWHRVPPISQHSMRDTFACRGANGEIVYTGSFVSATSAGKLYLYRSLDMVNWDEIEIWDWKRQQKLFEKQPRANPLEVSSGKVFSYMDTEVWYLNDTYYVGFSVYSARPSGFILKSTTGKVEGPYEPAYIGPNAQVTFFEDVDGQKYVAGNQSYLAWKDDLSGPVEGAKRQPIFAADGSLMVGDAAGQLSLIDGTYVHSNCGADGSHHLFHYSDPSSYTWTYQTAPSLEGPWSRERVVGPHTGHGGLVEDRFGNWWACSFINEASQGQPCMNFATAYIHPLDLRWEDGELRIDLADEFPDYVEKALQAKEHAK